MSNTITDQGNPIENYKPIERKRFQIPNGPKDHTLALFIGPTRGGKSFQMKKMLLDCWDTPYGENPFEIVYYVGQEKSFQEMRTAFAAMEFNYTGKKSAYKIQLKLYTCTQLTEAINDIMSADSNTKKFAIFDDCFSINATNKIRTKLINLLQQGQHYSLTSWVVVHAATERDGAGIRRPANYFMFCNESSQTVGFMCEISPDSQPMASYELSANALEGHKFLIFDKSNSAFYDYKYLKI